ncbi:MAG: helix-turn-helix transcriptional regulator [Ruminococcaceae bacterium]|nr:helix-turn-helix transcriptional regulator [Oscillospiraceae bacterium]
MKLAIGETIRRMRRSRDITQEDFAEMLGVSCQSVSRWETGQCYPDIELIPQIAAFFGVSTDTLLNVDEEAKKAKIRDHLDAFQEAISRGRVYDCIDAARAGVAEFPNDFALLNKLMYALFIATDEDGNIPEWRENQEKFDAEIVALGERIIRYCPDQEIRLEATARLAFHHCEMGRREKGREIYDTLPKLYGCRELNAWWGLEEDEKLPFVRDQIAKGYELLGAGMYSMISERLLPDEELLRVFEKWEALINLVCDDNRSDKNWAAANLPCKKARTCLRLGRTEKALAELRLAVKNARAFDNRPASGGFESLLLGKVEWKRTDFETDDTRPLCEIMRDKWFAHPDFDTIRDTEAFREIVRGLSK